MKYLKCRVFLISSLYPEVIPHIGSEQIQKYLLRIKILLYLYYQNCLLSRGVRNYTYMISLHKFDDRYIQSIKISFYREFSSTLPTDFVSVYLYPSVFSKIKMGYTQIRENISSFLAQNSWKLFFNKLFHFLCRPIIFQKIRHL